MDGGTTPITPVSASAHAALDGAARGLRHAQKSFLAVLGRATTDPSASREDQAREAAKQFVSQTLVQPILKQVREMDNTAPPFAPGPGEKQFRALMDAELAQRVTNSTRFALIDRVARQLLKRVADGPGAPAPPPPPVQQAIDPASVRANLAGALSVANRPSLTASPR